MIKRILLPLELSASSQSALSISCSFSGIIGAELRGLYVEDEGRMMELPLATAIAENVTGNPIVKQPLAPEELLAVEEQFAREAEQLERLFHAACDEASIVGTFERLRAPAIEAITYRARTADFVIMGGSRGHTTYRRGHEPGSIVNALLRETTRPILVVPDEPEGESRVVIAYDGSNAAERALCVGAEFAELTEMHEVHLLTVGTDSAAARKLQESAVEYLTAYQVDVHRECLTGRPAEVICSYADRVDATIVTLGAFGSNRIKEMIFGSTTRRVLDESNAAVLLVP